MVVDPQSDIQESFGLDVFITCRFSAPIEIGSFL